MLTRLPVRSVPDDRLGARWFGLVGALVGAVGAVPLLVLGGAFAGGAGILALATMAVLSGALHLDGLADTADALVAIGPGAAERARKDPSIGVAGAVALILVLGLDAASLAALAARSGASGAALACLAGGAISRAVPVVLGWATRSRASGTGLGAAFTRRLTVVDAAIAAVTALALAGVAAVVDGAAGLLMAGGLGLAGGLVLGLLLVRLRGRLDGDGLGATVELGLAATLLSAATIGRWPAA